VTLREYQVKAIENIQAAYRQKYKAPCLVAPCGAGKSVIVAEMAKRTAERKNRVLFLVHRQELCEQIENTFKWWGVDMEYVQIGMVQTITRRLKSTLEPKLIITDENHHCLATTYKKIYNFFPDAFKIGVTATPVRLDGSGLKAVNDVLVNTVSCKWLIKNNFLAPYKYFAPELVDFSKLKTKRGEFVVGEVDELINQKVICGNAIAHYKKICDGKKAICYCASIAHSQRMAEEFNEVGIPAIHIDGETPKNQRKEAIDKFRNGEIKILCNVDLISEGFDVPDCEVAILLRPTQSLTLFIQQSMRCMRYQPGKTAIILDHVGNNKRHGLPDADRVWTLDGIDKKDKKASEVKIRQCPECYFTFESTSICPNCGCQSGQGERSPLKEVDGDLKEITGIVIDYSEPEDCKTYKELQELGRRRGYKPGWAWITGQRLGLINRTG